MPSEWKVRRSGRGGGVRKELEEEMGTKKGGGNCGWYRK